MPRKRKQSPGTGKENNEPKRQRVRVTNTANEPLTVSIGAIQDALSVFLINYLAFGPYSHSYTEIAFLAILSSRYKSCTVAEIYQFIEEMFPGLPKEILDKYKKRVRHTIVKANCFSFYTPDSEPQHDTAPAKTSFKIKTLYGVVPTKFVEKIATGFYRKSATEKEEFKNGQHKWANYGPEAKNSDLWKNVSRFVEMQLQTRIEVIEKSENKLECLNSPSISIPSQTGMTAETKSFQPTVPMKVDNLNHTTKKSKKALEPLNSPSISTPNQTGVTAETKSFQPTVPMKVDNLNHTIKKSKKALEPLNSPSISTPNQTGVTAETKSFQPTVPMKVENRNHTTKKLRKHALEPLNSPSISTPSQTGVTAETKSFQPTVPMKVENRNHTTKKLRKHALEPINSPSISTPSQTDVTAETESFDLSEPDMDILISQYITGDPAMELLTSDFAEYPTSDNGACGTTLDSNMSAWQAYPPRPDTSSVSWGSHLSKLPEPPSYPLKPVPETPKESPKTFTGDVNPLEPMNSPSISTPCQTDVTAETESYDLFNGACGTTWDSNMPAWQTYSHMSQLTEPPSCPSKPETPSKSPKSFTSEDLQAVIKANEDTYCIFGHKFKRDTVDDVSNNDEEE